MTFYYITFYNDAGTRQFNVLCGKNGDDVDAAAECYKNDDPKLSGVMQPIVVAHVYVH